MTNHQITTASPEVQPVAVVYKVHEFARVTVIPGGLIACDCTQYATNRQLYTAECDHTRLVQKYRAKPLEHWTH